MYATRKGSASTAVGYSKVHAKEQEEVVRESLQGGKRVAFG